MDEFLHELKLAPIKVGAGSFMGPNWRRMVARRKPDESLTHFRSLRMCS
jgi:hypothetical protein